MNQHLSDGQLLDSIYGIAEPDTHLDSCSHCQARWELMQTRREQTLSPLPNAGYFHRQRREMQIRMSEPSRGHAVWVPATVALALMAGVLMTRTSPPVPMQRAKMERAETGIIEAGWFEDTYSATQQIEPLAASPVRGLFLEGPVLE